MREEQWQPYTNQCYSTDAALSRNASLLGENTADSKGIPDPCHNSHRCASGICCGTRGDSSSLLVALGSGCKGISHTSSVGRRSCNTGSTLQNSSSSLLSNHEEVSDKHVQLIHSWKEDMICQGLETFWIAFWVSPGLYAVTLLISLLPAWLCSFACNGRLW